MWIHLLRHGIAIDRDDPRCPADAKRPLTDRGLKRTRAAARGLRAIGVDPDVVLVSPYLRAQQTADVVLEVLSSKLRGLRTPSLTPNGDAETILEAIADTDGQSVLCVGHAPSLDELAAYLVGSDREVVSLKKAGLATVQMSTVRRGGGRLFAVLTPAMLRALG